MTPQEREREARARIWILRGAISTPVVVQLEAALDEYRAAVEARVRWEQQADAEGYNLT